MSGIGRFRLTDALSKLQADTFGHQAPSSSLGAKGKDRSKNSTKVKPGAIHEQITEQVRETRETARAEHNEALIRGHMVDIARVAQQGGRQKAK